MNTKPVEMVIPRGLEVLVKKAAVDAAFRDCLLRERDRAAARIGLVLEPAEAALLRAIPAAQLEAVVANTTVPPRFRAVFMGYAAAAMLAAVATLTACKPRGDRIENLPAPTGISPDIPPTAATGATAATGVTASPSAATAATADTNIGLSEPFGGTHTGSSPGIGGMRPDHPIGGDK